jgi:hypothetical protein
VGARGNGAEAIGRDAGVSIAVRRPGGQRREGNSDAQGTCQRRKRSARRDAELSRGSNREARLGGWERGLHRLFRFSPEMDRPLPLALSSTIVAACLSPKIPGEPCLHGCVPPRFLPAQPVENSWLWPVRPLARTPTVVFPLGQYPTVIVSSATIHLSSTAVLMLLLSPRSALANPRLLIRLML